MSSALVKPEPAVGQYWIRGEEIVLLSRWSEERGGYFWIRPFGREDDLPERYAPSYILRECTYLGTLDGLRARATASDLLYTDNSAVVARLSAENERLQAEVAKLKAE
jgi:hypothetical protein